MKVIEKDLYYLVIEKNNNESYEEVLNKVQKILNKYDYNYDSYFVLDNNKIKIQGNEEVIRKLNNYLIFN